MENPTRRRVLAAGLAGSALGLIRGRAASAGTVPPTEEPATQEPVVGLPPARPTPEDLERLAFAETVELAARDLYQVSIDAGVDDPTIVLLRDNHEAYADVLSGILGIDAPGRPDDRLYDELESSFAVGDVVGAAEAGYELESSLVATYIDMLRSLEGTDGAELIASILVVEARNCTILADLAGNGADLDALFVNDAAALAMSRPTGG